jgi:hypothetical protein
MWCLFTVSSKPMKMSLVAFLRSKVSPIRIYLLRHISREWYVSRLVTTMAEGVSTTPKPRLLHTPHGDTKQDITQWGRI